MRLIDSGSEYNCIAERVSLRLLQRSLCPYLPDNLALNYFQLDSQRQTGGHTVARGRTRVHHVDIVVSDVHSGAGGIVGGKRLLLDRNSI